MNRVIASMLSRVQARVAPHPRVLLLGLGAGCGIAEIYRSFPDASITAVEYDTEMIRLSHELMPWSEHAEPTIINADASDAIRNLAPGFDLIVIDIFEIQATGRYKTSIPSHLLLEPAFATALRDLLAPYGVAVANVLNDMEHFSALAGAFDSSEYWKRGGNQLGAFWTRP